MTAASRSSYQALIHLRAQIRFIEHNERSMAAIPWWAFWEWYQRRRLRRERDALIRYVGDVVFEAVKQGRERRQLRQDFLGTLGYLDQLEHDAIRREHSRCGASITCMYCRDADGRAMARKVGVDLDPPAGTDDIRPGGPLTRSEARRLRELAAEIANLIACGTCPSMVDVESMARLAARAGEDEHGREAHGDRPE